MIQASGKMTDTSVSEKSPVLQAGMVRLSYDLINNVNILVGRGMPWAEKFRVKVF